MATKFLIGDQVRVSGTDQVGCITAISRRWAIVSLPFSKLKISLDRLQHFDLPIVPPLSSSLHSYKDAAGSGKLQLHHFLNFSPTIDLHGLCVDTALAQLDRWIDQAIVAGHSQLKIIHGKGQGILRRHIHSYLSRHASVTKIIQDHNMPGGWGVTWINL